MPALLGADVCHTQHYAKEVGMAGETARIIFYAFLFPLFVAKLVHGGDLHGACREKDVIILGTLDSQDFTL